MKKVDIKNAVDLIQPDPYMETRLKAKSIPVKTRSRILGKVTAGAIALCFIFAMVFGLNLPTSTTTPNAEGQSQTIQQNQVRVNPFIMVASAIETEAEFKTLNLNDAFPFAYKISLIDVRGMNKSDREKIYLNERDTAIDYSEAVGNSRVTVRGAGENVILTEYYANYIKLDLKNIENVKSINAKTSTKWGQIEYYDTKLIETEIEKGNTTPIPHGQEITISAEQYHNDCEGFSWKNTAEMTQAIDENPDASLSMYSDTITFTVEYKDGSKEIGIIDVVFDDEGNGSFISREYSSIS